MPLSTQRSIEPAWPDCFNGKHCPGDFVSFERQILERLFHREACFLEHQGLFLIDNDAIGVAKDAVSSGVTGGRYLIRVQFASEDFLEEFDSTGIV